MTEAEKWAAHDIAKQALSILIGDYAERIYLEEKKDAPDQRLIDQWDEKQHAMTLLQRSLTIEDMATILRVNETHCPAARTIMQRA